MAWSQRARSGAPTQRAIVVRAYPHDPDAFSQGLAYHKGFLYEGTGNYGKSSVRQVVLETGKVVQRRDLDPHLFGEGITVWQNRVWQLTWKSREAILYDVSTLAEAHRFRYRGEGWGITHDEHYLIMSDGTPTLRFLDPRTFAVKRRLMVREGSRRIGKLNELEYIAGEIWANIWYDDRVARISPKTGQVLAWIDLSGLYPTDRRHDRDNVLNGIAYDAQQQRIFVTGKNWPRLFEIRLAK